MKVASLGAELAAARQSADQYRTEMQSAREMAERHVRSIEQLSQSTDEMRKFALIGIDDARSEVRQWKERCTQLELLRHKDAQAMDALRRTSFDQARVPATKGPGR